MKLIDMTAQRFGRLLVLRKDPAPRMWVCRCDCGAEKLVTGSNLRSGAIQSCGCLALEWAKKLGADPGFIAKRSASSATHGHKRRGGATATYRIWLGMKRRCTDTKHKDYPNWGGRGIRVCDRWDKSFADFLADMGERPPGLTIDRIDPNGPYAPGNCRWATLQQQGAEHRRGLKAVEVHDTGFASVAAAAKAHGVRVGTAHMRIYAGIDPQVAVSHAGRLRPRR